MTKTVDQREKDLKDGVTWDVATAWSKAIGGFEKDLKAPLFLKSGNIAAFAAQYDTLQSTFNKHIDQKTGTTDGLDNVWDSQLTKIDGEIAGLGKELNDISKDEVASQKSRTSDTPEAKITWWENSLKTSQDIAKEQKAVFDRWMKLNADYVKVQADAIAKVKKELAAASAGLKTTNDQLNVLEKRMRDAVAAYSNTATSMNRQDIASAVRGFLAIFAKA